MHMLTFAQYDAIFQISQLHNYTQICLKFIIAIVTSYKMFINCIYMSIYKFFF